MQTIYMEIKQIINETQNIFARENISQMKAIAQHKQLIQILKTIKYVPLCFLQMTAILSKSLLGYWVYDWTYTLCSSMVSGSARRRTIKKVGTGKMASKLLLACQTERLKAAM
ncbi:hypothetical protein ACEQPO_10290 [Bacillus sp. SL00103]